MNDSTDVWKNRLIAMALIVLLGVLFVIVVDKGKSDNEKTLDQVKVTSDQLVDLQDKICISANSTRLTLYSDAQRDAREAREFAGQEHDPEIRAIWLRRARAKDNVAESILAAAAQRGVLIDPNQPIVAC